MANSSRRASSLLHYDIIPSFDEKFRRFSIDPGDSVATGLICGGLVAQFLGRPRMTISCACKMRTRDYCIGTILKDSSHYRWWYNRPLMHFWWRLGMLSVLVWLKSEAISWIGWGILSDIGMVDACSCRIAAVAHDCRPGAIYESSLIKSFAGFRQILVIWSQYEHFWLGMLDKAFAKLWGRQFICLLL